MTSVAEKDRKLAYYQYTLSTYKTDKNVICHVQTANLKHVYKVPGKVITENSKSQKYVYIVYITD